MTYTEDILKAPMDELVCYCSKVSKGQILEAIKAGAKTMEDLKTITGACQIGRCKESSPRKR